MYTSASCAATTAMAKRCSSPPDRCSTSLSSTCSRQWSLCLRDSLTGMAIVMALVRGRAGRHQHGQLLLLGALMQPGRCVGRCAQDGADRAPVPSPGPSAGMPSPPSDPSGPGSRPHSPCIKTYMGAQTASQGGGALLLPRQANSILAHASAGTCNISEAASAEGGS